MITNSYRDIRQRTVTAWALKCFPKEEVKSIQQRAIRFFEEAVELMLPCKVSKEECIRVLNHVYSKPVGNMSQEIGGCHTTLLVLCEAAGLSANDCEREEIARVLSLPPAYFTERNKLKNDAGLLANVLQKEKKLENSILQSEENMSQVLQKTRDENAQLRLRIQELELRQDNGGLA